MPKKSISTPTLTESRAKRTPKPNPKYAVDYVAKIRISPDRKTEDDDDYSPISKKRNDEDLSEDNSQLNKSTKKKVVTKNPLTPEPSKLSNKTSNTMMSRLSTLRNMPKRGSPVPPSKTSSGKSTPLSSKSSEKKIISSPNETKAVSTSESKAGTKRTAKSDSIVSPTLKVSKRSEKVDEIRIVNINDIMKKTEGKSGEDIREKKQKLNSNEVEIIDIEEEISVSSALVKPSTRQKPTTIEKPEVKQKSQVKAAQTTQNQLSSGHKRKLTDVSPQNQPSKSNQSLIAKSKAPANKISVPSKIHENKEELGQVLAKRILRKVVKPAVTATEVTEFKNDATEKPKPKKPINTLKMKKVTTFEKWSILNFPQIQPQPARSVLCLSLIKLGNKIKQIKLPSSEWSYRITLQKINKENSDKGEIYTGDIEDCGINEGEKGNYSPVNITFERSSSNASTPANRSVVFQNKSFSISMDGKPCKLIGAPQYIYDLIEIQTLLHIVDQVDPFHSYVDHGEK